MQHFSNMKGYIMNFDHLQSYYRSSNDPYMYHTFISRFQKLAIINTIE